MSTGKRLTRIYDTPFVGSAHAADPLFSTAVNPPAPLSDGVAPPAPPAPPAPQPIGAPQNLHLVSTTLVESGTVGKWFAVVAWDAVDGAARYHLEWSPLGFGGAVIPIETTGPSATFEVYMNRSYDVRVYAVGTSGALSGWSSTLTFLSDIDPTAPGQPTAVSAVFADSGDLIVSWTPGTGAQLKDTLVDLFASAVMTGPALRRFAVTGHTFTWSLQDNLAIGGLTDVWVRLSSRSYAGVLALPVTPTVQPSFATPAAPTVTPSWNLQTGAMTLAWSISPRAVKYEVYVDSALQPQQITNRYVYSLDQNKAAHGGNPYQLLSYGIQGWDVFGRVGPQAAGSTSAPFPPDPTNATSEFDGPDALLGWAESVPVASFDLVIDGVTRSVTSTQYLYSFARNATEHSGSADPVLTCTVRARSILNMVSGWLSFTATNPAPAAPSAVVAVGGMAQIAVAATATLPPDLRALSYRIVKDSTTLTTISSQSAHLTYTAQSSGSYQIGVSVVDVFGQSSSETLSSAVVLDVLTIADLRAGTTYTDDNGSSAATLALLKDDNRSGPGVNYSGAARITTATRPQADRIRRITLAGTVGQGYISTSTDGVTWQWFAGPLTSGVLTAAAQQAAAAAAPVAFPLNGAWDLPSAVDCRIVRLHHSGIGGVGYSLYEFYPRRLVESDDVRAEAIKAIHIGAGEVTADKINVLSLAAVAAQTGTLDVSGALTLGAGGKLRTASDETTFDATGLSVTAVQVIGYDPYASVPTPNTYRVKDSTGTIALFTAQDYLSAGNVHSAVATLRGIARSGGHAAFTTISAESDGTGSYYGPNPNGNDAVVALEAKRGAQTATITVASRYNGSTIALTAAAVSIAAPTTIAETLNVGLATGNGDAYIRANRGSTAFLLISAGSATTFFDPTVTGGGATVRLLGNSSGLGPANAELLAGLQGSIGLFTAPSSGTSTRRLHIDKDGYIGIHRDATNTTDSATNANGTTLIIKGHANANTGLGAVLATYSANDILTFQVSDGGEGYLRSGLRTNSAGYDPNIANNLRGYGTTNKLGLRVSASNGTTNLDVGDNGYGYLRAASWVYGSDERLKTNIAPYDLPGLDVLEALRVVGFDYRDGATNQIGFIAQEVERVLPQPVGRNADGMRTLTSFEPFIVGWLQQIAARLAALEAAA